MLTHYFEAEGFSVELLTTGAQLRSKLDHLSCDLVLLDLGLPDADGLVLAREIRARSEVGLIILTGRGDEVDRIVGLEIGADDYIVKPFNLREVLARVKSVLRRLQPAGTGGMFRAGQSRFFRFERWSFDLDLRRLTRPNGVEAQLSTGEFDILSIFVVNAGRVLTREFLMEQTRGRAWEAYDRTIDAQVSRLRRKLEVDPAEPQMLKSVRGVGYVFAAKVAEIS
jgi:two-component system phosphate regulon response regulator OmpR